MKRLQSSNWPIIALVAAVVILALAGVALLAAYFLMSQPATAADPGWVNPLSALESAAVAPDLAVLTLAGEPDDRVIRAALDANEIETAHAGVAYSVLLSDQLRSGQWLLLATKVVERDADRGLIAYQAALDESALGPALNDLGRADISLQVARGFMALQKPELARLATAQAENIARFSLSLLPGQRRSVLQAAAAAYELLGDDASVQAIHDNMEAYSSGPGVDGPRVDLLLPTLRGVVALPQEVASALALRQEAAAALAARWLSAAPTERSNLVQALGEALAAENEARSAWYAGGEGLELPDRLALLHDRIAWLVVKYRASRGDFGTSLVSDWEAQSGQIEVELTETFTALINGYGQQLDILDPVEALQARVELLRQSVLWTRLGLFPGEAEDKLRADLIDAARQLWTRQGGAGLTVVAQDVNSRLLYLLAGSDSSRPTAAAERRADVGRP
jgi:hypothetical protein